MTEATETPTITARPIRSIPPAQTGLPVPAELWETSELVAVGHWLQPIRTRHMLLVEGEAGVTHRWGFIAATPAGLVDLRHWKIRETDKFETRADLLAATGFVIASDEMPPTCDNCGAWHDTVFTPYDLDEGRIHLCQDCNARAMLQAMTGGGQ